MSRITREQADALADKHGEGAAFAVYPPSRHAVIFDDFDEAIAYADEVRSSALDWSTGEYAD